MTIAELVRAQGKNAEYFVWTDTRKCARIRRNLGDPQTFDRGETDPLRNVRVNSPSIYRNGWGTIDWRLEIAYYVLNGEEKDPSKITVQYVEAKR